jgi:hypothetical protein
VSPYVQLCNGLQHVRNELNEEIDEMLAFTEVMANRQNAVHYDNQAGMFYVTAAGNIDEIILVMKLQLEKLERIKKQNDCKPI